MCYSLTVYDYLLGLLDVIYLDGISYRFFCVNESVVHLLRHSLIDLRHLVCSYRYIVWESGDVFF